MISLYTDEDVDISIKPLLNVKGFTVFTALEEKMLGKNDREQLEHSIKLRSVLLTHNRSHFEKLSKQIDEESVEYSGIIIATRRNTYELVPRLCMERVK